MLLTFFMDAGNQPPDPQLPLVPQSQSTNGKSTSNRIEVWKEYEVIAMHFNDLLIRLRTQALGGVAAVAVLAAVIVRGDISVTLRWEVLVAAFSMLLLFWVAVYFLDTLYYDRLLEGAVDAIVELEESDKKGNPFPGLQMSTRIEEVVATGKPTRLKTSWRVHAGRRIFYYTVFGTLVFGLAVSLYGFFNAGVTSIAEGVVTDAQTGSPVADATIVITPMGKGSISTSTRNDGTFFTVLPSQWQNPLKEAIPYQIPFAISAKGYHISSWMIRSKEFECGTNYFRLKLTRSVATP
jgi:hypothetical protein